MPFLTLQKDEKTKPIAILKTSKANKVVYISENEGLERERVEIDFKDIDKRISGNKTKDKIRMYDMVQKGLARGLKAEEFDLLTDNDQVQKVYRELQDESGKSIKVGHDSHFEVMPVVPDEKGNGRDCIYITGCSGSGKSWFARSFCENYDKLHKGKRPIYLISQLKEDETLDSANCKINRIKLESICDDPIDLNTKEMTDCMILFDDWDTIENTQEHKFSDAIWKLLDQCLIMGRHYNITVLVISHYNTNGKKGRLILTECNKYVVYPHGTSAHALKYLLGHHVGIDPKEIKELGKLGRWICLQKTYPKYLISEHVVKLI
jgi:hypothetical protein